MITVKHVKPVQFYLQVNIDAYVKIAFLKTFFEKKTEEAVAGTYKTYVQ